MDRSGFHMTPLVISLLLLALSAPNAAAQSYIFGRADFPLSGFPSSVATGDFNGDGLLDVAVADVLQKHVSILLRRPDGTLAPGVDYALGGGPTSLVAADFNGDGTLDLAVTNGNNSTVSILLGNGDGTFQVRVDYQTGFEPRGLAAIDLNRDGKIDLVTGNGSLSVSVLLGNGDGTFQDHVEYAAAPGGGAGPGGTLVAADLNGDGIPDLAVLASDQNAVSVLLGNGDGTFKAFVAYPTGIEPSGIAIADLNGDGKLDLVVTNLGFLNGTESNSVSILMGNGDGSFQTHVDYAVGPHPLSVIVNDINRDAKPDLVITNDNCTGSPCSFGSISILLGNGDGTFGSRRDYGTGTYPTIALGDFNGDGLVDMAIAHQNCIGSPCDIEASISILLGNGDGSFSSHVDYPTPTIAESVAITDINGDGKPDLVVTHANDQTLPTLSVLLGNGDGTFQGRTDYMTGSGPGFVVTADFNGDGRSDLAIANPGGNTISVLLGNGDGTLQSHVDYATDANPRQLITGDFNGDGKLDLVTVNGGAEFNDTVSILLGNGDGTFRPHSDFLAGLAANALTAGDFNGDGKLDLAVSNGSGPGTVSVLLGNGDGTFRPPIPYATGLYPSSVAAADLNGDGRLDLVLTDTTQNTPTALSVLLGNGDGTFSTHIDFPAGSFPKFVSFGDLNSDGKLDVVVGSGSGISILPGNGDGSFRSHIDYITGQTIDSIDVGDLIGDGGVDTVAANQAGSVSVFLNTPVVFLFPDKLSFADQVPGTTSSPKTLTLSNAGNRALAISNISVSGDFAQTKGCPSKLAPGGSCTINITFSPSSTGTRIGTISIADSAPGSPQLIRLVGNPPAASLSSSNVNFTSQLVGTTSSTQSMTLTNSGTAAISIGGILLGGLNTRDFSENNNCFQSIAAGASCSINVTFSPSMRGVRAAKISVFDDAGKSPQIVNVSGTGIAPVVSLSGSSLAFGDQLLNAGSTAQTVTLANTGDAPLTIRGVAITGDFAQSNNCASNVALGANCAISVTFTPRSLGPQVASLTITDNAEGSPHTIALSGTGVQPVVRLSDGGLSFGNQLVGTASTAKQVTLSNIGSGALTITSITVSGDFTQTNDCGSAVGAGASCTITVAFAPKTSGATIAALAVNDNAPGSPHSVALSGTGTDFSFGVPSGSAAAVTVTAGQTAVYSLQLTSISGFGGTVSLSCSGAPNLSTCTISPSSLTVTSTAAVPVSVSITTTATMQVAGWIESPTIYFGNDAMLSAVFAVPFIVSIWYWASNTPRRLRSCICGIGLMVAVVLLSACGGGSHHTITAPGTPAGTYTLVVTGTSNGVNHSFNLQLTVN